MILDLNSLNPTFFLFDHGFILLISMLAEFTSSVNDSPLMFIIKLTANANAYVRLVMLRFIILLYCMLQKSSLQHETWGHTLTT